MYKGRRNLKRLKIFGKFENLSSTFNNRKMRKIFREIFCLN